MTVPSTARRAGPYNGNGVTTTFSFSFKTFAAADLQVTRTSATGIETTLVLNSDYSVSLNGDQDASPGGTITYPISGAALASGQRLTIVGNLAYEQTTDLLGGGAFNARVVEDTFDRTVIQIQQLEERADRALALPVSAASVSTTLPVPEGSALLGWNGGGTALQNVPLSSLATAVAYGSMRYQTFVGNGTTTTFALTHDPATVANLDVSIAGVVQVPGTDYTLVGQNVVFTSAPPNGVTILVRYGQALGSVPSDSNDISFQAAGTGAVTRTAQSKLRDVVSVKDFGAVGDGVTNDTAAIQAAINALPAYGELVFSAATYKTNGVIEITAANRRINFGSATFLVGDTGAAGTLTNAASGKIGFLFKNATNVVVTGSPRFIGQGTLGTTSLAGVVFDTCANAIVSAEMYFENMAAGRMVLWCDDSAFGDIEGKNISGLQTFESPPTSPQGTLEDIVGCRRSRFGNLKCSTHVLPARYLSISLNGVGAAIDNENCVFGNTSSSGTGSSASTLAVRSAVNCGFGDIVGTSVSYLALFVIYAGNTQWSVNKNTVGNITGSIAGSAGTEYGVAVYSDEPTKPIGQLQFGNANLSGPTNADYAVIVTSGNVHFSSVTCSGFARSMAISNCTFSCSVLTANGQSQESILIGQGANCSFNTIRILSGAASVTTAAIRYDSATGTGGIGVINLGNITYRFNATGNDYLYPVMNLSAGFESFHINSIDGAGSGGAQARFASDEFFVRRNLWSSTVVPTSGTYSVGTVLWKSNAAAGGTPGWVCTTAGTPGTWKAMANLAP